MQSAYEKDFHQWSLDQAHLIKIGDFKKLDIEHLIEEIETLGNSEKRALRSFMTVLMKHLLKIKYQPEKHTSSWDRSIKYSRREIEDILKENPSFKRFIPEYIKTTYLTAVESASDETNKDESDFPTECPWTFEEIMKE